MIAKKARKLIKIIFQDKNIQGLTFYNIQPLNNLLSVFQGAIPFLGGTILLGFRLF